MRSLPTYTQRWRVVAIGQNQRATGIAPECEHEGDTDKIHSPYTYSCCPPPHIEIGREDSAARVVRLLNSLEALRVKQVSRARWKLTLACAALFVVSLVLIRATW